MTRNIAGLSGCGLPISVLLFVSCELAIATVRFLRTPASDFTGSHRPGPLDGLSYLAFVLFHRLCADGRTAAAPTDERRD